MNSEPQAKIRKVTELDADYPRALLELEDRPPVLYIKGRWPFGPECRLGIVGTRHPSAYGIEVARHFSREIVDHGFVTVSGLAAGIDACVHRTTLDQGGWTVAVLGHGFGYKFPKENGALFDEIATKGTLVTEFPYDTPPHSTHFPQRNRIISGLSQGVLVIEAGKRSGALITARNAAEQGRDVFVVPGSIYSGVSRGCHRLIKEGARLVESPEEILEEYGFTAVLPAGGKAGPPNVRQTPATPSADNDQNLSLMEKNLLNLVSCVPVSVDELAELSRLSVDRLAEVLLSLEIKGRIRAMPGQSYVANN